MILTRLVENNLTQFSHIVHVLSDILDRRNNSRLFACVSKSEKVSEADAGITLLAPRRPCPRRRGSGGRRAVARLAALRAVAAVAAGAQDGGSRWPRGERHDCTAAGHRLSLLASERARDIARHVIRLLDHGNSFGDRR